MDPTPKYPEARMNTFDLPTRPTAIALAAGKALRRVGVPGEEREVFYKEALSGDYHHVLLTALKWVKVEWYTPMNPEE